MYRWQGETQRFVPITFIQAYRKRWRLREKQVLLFLYTIIKGKDALNHISELFNYMWHFSFYLIAMELLYVIPYGRKTSKQESDEIFL